MNVAGEPVNLRAVRKEDVPLLAKVFAGLSPASRAARYLAPKRAITAAELRYFTDIDHHNHEALIALSRLSDEPVGVVHFVRDAANPASADVAIEVVDAWQNRGVAHCSRRAFPLARSENASRSSPP